MEFKLGAVTYNFDEMIVYSTSGYSKLKVHNGKLHRIGLNKMMEVSPTVNDAYFEYEIEKILLGDKDVDV